MIKTIIIFSLILCFPITANAKGDDALLCRTQFHAGSAKALNEKILQVNIFVSKEGERAWTKTHKDQILQFLPDVQNWLSSQLKKYGRHINMEYANFGYENDIKSVNIPTIEKIS